MGYKKVPADIDARIVALRTKGHYTIVQIAAALKVSKNTVARRLGGCGFDDMRRRPLR